MWRQQLPTQFCIGPCRAVVHTMPFVTPQSVISVTAFALALSGALLLLWAGIGHLRHFGRLRAALAAQQIFPFRWQRTVGRTVVAGEITVGVAALTAAAAGAGEGFVALAIFYGVMSVYVTALLLGGKAVPCGCFGSGEPVTGYVLLRCLVFALAAAVAGLAGMPDPDVGSDAGTALLLAAAAVVFALLARSLPAVYRKET